MAGTHAARSSRGPLPWIIGAVVALAVLIVAGVVILASRSSTHASPTSSPHVSHLAVLDATPTNAATVDSTASIRVALNAPLAANSPLPTLSPAVAGHWERLSPSVLTFVQSNPLSPGQNVTITVPGGAKGLISTTGARLAATSTSSFQVAPPGVSTATEAGTFSWRWSTLPATLTSQWTAGEGNVITQGAIMNFENLHNMTPDGQAGPQVWNQLLADRAASKDDPNPYTYVYVAQTASESLTLYSNGGVVYESPVNTGVKGARTAVGTFPVFEHLRVTTMSGTNPDGTKYHDTGIPWTSYFHGGDALHGFIRASYGTPQSDGCVEMPFANAGIVWPQTPIGTLVTVGPLATA